MQISENISKIISICSKRSADRASYELNTLVDLTKSCKVFKALIDANGNGSHYQCCKYLKYQFCIQGEYLFKFGEKGTKFYIIVKGLVGVELPKKGIAGETVNVEVTALGDGCSFGELALESSKPRSASIKCKVDSHFIYLEKIDYDKLISKIVQDKRDALVDFLQSLPAFMKCTKGTLTKLTYAFRERNFNKGHVVFHEGEIADEIYLIKQGEFEFFKMIKKVKKKNGEVGIKPKDKIKRCKIANYGSGEMFGEEDTLRNLLRSSTCKCVQNESIILAINKADFLKQVLHEDTLEYINSRIAKKQSEFQKRTDMLVYITNDQKKKISSEKRKPLLCHELEVESKQFVLVPQPTLTFSNDFDKISPLKNKFTETTRSPVKSQRKLEKKHSLPSLPRFINRRNSTDSINIEKFVPMSESGFKRCRGMSIVSMNSYHLYNLSKRREI